jgi:enoyl-CoA hydratase/carnithine racemase
MVPRCEHLKLVEDGPVLWITIERPDCRNALSLQTWSELRDTVAWAGRQSLRVVVVSGSGDEAFVSGADIREFPAARANPEQAVEYDRVSHAALHALTQIEQPVVAMINGLCFGGGVALALACDFRIAASHARFCIPAVRLGLSYPLRTGIAPLVRTIGPTAAAEMLLCGRVLDADEAHRLGLLHRVVPASELVNETRAYVARLLESAPLTLAAHKAAIRALLAELPADTRVLEEKIQRCFASADYREGVDAFLEKRKPKFRGH